LENQRLKAAAQTINDRVEVLKNPPIENFLDLLSPTNKIMSALEANEAAKFDLFSRIGSNSSILDKIYNKDKSKSTVDDNSNKTT
jgi:hypothetical protein